MSRESIEDQARIARLEEEVALLKEGVKQGERIRKKMVSLLNELKAARFQLEASAGEKIQILNSLAEMIFLLDPHGYVRLASQVSLDMLGLPESDVIGKHVSTFIVEDEHNSLSDFALFSSLVTKRQAADLRAVVLGKDDQKIPVLLHGAEISGSPTGARAMVLSARDVRDSRILQMLRDSNSQLIQTAKLASLGELSAGFAHELNNPLMFVMGFNSRIRAALENPAEVSRDKLMKYSQEIDLGATRMKSIIKHFLDFSRQANDKVELIDLRDAIQNSLTLMGEQLRLRSIKVRTDLGSNGLMVKGNKVRLEQIFVNLISNARDALDEKGPEYVKQITIRAEMKPDCVIVDFEDNGPGIPPAVQERMFDPFFTTKPAGKGTGLGMSIVHRIIEEHKAKLTLKSSPGQTVFSLRFPKALN